MGRATRSKTTRKGSFVSVLIDGHTHPFCADFFGSDLDGTVPGAKRLKHAVGRYLPLAIPDADQCAIDIQFYAAFQSLDRFTYTDMNADPSQTLDAITSSFNETFGTAGYKFQAFDCVDEDRVEHAIEKAYFKAMNDSDCQHILLAAWGKPLYRSMLAKTVKTAWKVTFIEGKSVQIGAGIEKLEVASAVTIFEDVFRPTLGQNRVAIDSAARELDPSETNPRATMASGDMAWNATLTVQSTGRRKKKPRKPPANETVVISPLCQLPRVSKAGHFPVNKAGHRLDVFLKRPHTSAFRAYKKHKAKHEKIPCVRFHNNESCDDNCSHDHSGLTERMKYVARWVAKTWVCKEGSRCRIVNCLYGHVCQAALCRQDPKTAAACKLKESHNMDAVWTGWAPGNGQAI